MLTRLILEDFMAHGRTELPLGPGLTVLTGPNNVGKSAVVEALRCLASNPSPRHYIRHGAKEARVTAVLDDGTEVTWVRREKYAQYEILRPGAAEPELFTKLGKKGAVPEEVAALLRLDAVEVEGRAKSVDVHVGNQREPVFLLDESPAVMASLLAASTEAAHLLNMQKALAGRVRDGKKREKELFSRLARLDAQLDALAPLPVLGMRVEEAEALHGQVSAARAALPRLERLCADIARAGAEQKILAARLSGLARLAPPAAPAPVAGLAEWLRRHAVLDEARRTADSRRAALAPLAAPPEAADTAGPAKMLIGLSRLAATRDAAVIRAKALAPLVAPPEAADVAGPAAILREMARLKARQRPLAERLASFSALSVPPETVSVTALAAELAELRRVRAAAKSARNARDASLDAEKECAGRVRAALERAGSCPLCGQALDAAAFLARFAGEEGQP